LNHQKLQTEAKEKEVALLNKDKEIQNVEIKKTDALKEFLYCSAGSCVRFIFLYLQYLPHPAKIEIRKHSKQYCSRFA
jgi:hypothetical protein